MTNKEVKQAVREMKGICVAIVRDVNNWYTSISGNSSNDLHYKNILTMVEDMTKRIDKISEFVGLDNSNDASNYNG